MLASYYFEDGTPDYNGTATDAGYCCVSSWAGGDCGCNGQGEPSDEEMVDDGYHLEGGQWVPNPATEKGRIMLATWWGRSAALQEEDDGIPY